MKKFFYKLHNELVRYYPLHDFHNLNESLYLLMWCFNHCFSIKSLRLERNFIQNVFVIRFEQDVTLKIDKENRKVTIECRWGLKEESEEIEYGRSEEDNALDDAYDVYMSKRWPELPRLEMSFENYEEVLDTWELIKKQEPLYPYLVFSQDDAGYVRIEGKQELSSEDLEDIKVENAQWERRDRAYKRFCKDHPEYTDDDIWRGPQDNFFESDLEKYYEEEIKE